MPRFTLDKFTARKVEGQVKKDKFAYLAPAWSDVRKSCPPSGEIVLWDPPKELMQGVVDMMTHELGFTRDRQKGAIPYKSMTSTVEKAKGYININYPDERLATKRVDPDKTVAPDNALSPILTEEHPHEATAPLHPEGKLMDNSADDAADGT